MVSHQLCGHSTSVQHSICEVILVCFREPLKSSDSATTSQTGSSHILLTATATFFSETVTQPLLVVLLAQGSVLGPLLYFTSTTPFSRLTSAFNTSYHQFADDMQLYTSADSSSSADITRLPLCAQAVTKWYIKNS